MPASPPFILGIDGGATHSLGAVVDASGRILATARAGSLNFLGADLPTARRSLRRLVAALRRPLPPGADLAYTVVGCAALFTNATAAERRALCHGILPLAKTRVVSDAQTALFGATLGQPGLVIVAGTGSIVLAQGESGRCATVGGWGHQLGDEGSAWWIARESLRAALAAREGRGPATRLGEAACRYFRVRTLNDAVACFHAGAAKDRAAGLAAHLARSIGPRDRSFAAILDQAGRELARQALAAVRAARLKTRPVPVSLVGGVLTANRRVRTSLVHELRLALPVRIVAPRLPPVLGAAALGLAALGLPPPPTAT